MVGFLRNRYLRLRNLSAIIENRFCALHCVSLDGYPISQASSLLLTATSRSGNRGAKWNEKRTSLLEWGSGPMTVETVVGKVYLNGLKRVQSVDVVALDGNGRPLGEPRRAEQQGDGWELKIGETTTLWYHVRVRR